MLWVAVEPFLRIERLRSAEGFATAGIECICCLMKVAGSDREQCLQEPFPIHAGLITVAELEETP